MDGVPFVRLCVCGQDASFHEFESGFFDPVDEFVWRGTLCSAKSVFQFILGLFFGVIRPVPTDIDQVASFLENPHEQIHHSLKLGAPIGGKHPYSKDGIEPCVGLSRPVEHAFGDEFGPNIVGLHIVFAFGESRMLALLLRVRLAWDPLFR